MAERSKRIHTLEHPKPRALILATQMPGQDDADVAASCGEMKRLADTLEIEVCSVMVQKRRRASAANFVGPGKLAEIAQLTGKVDEDAPALDLPEARTEPAINLVLVDAELSPRQHRMLEVALGVEVLDRTAVILEIFEKRAGTREAALEVELARLRYELPRRRDVDAGNDRKGGGGRGAKGDTNLALSKARIRDRIAQLNAELAEVQAQATTQRARRQDAFQVALVGYTNAGKSSVMHGLTQSEILVEDQLFATLGTTVRQVQPPVKPPVLLSDTVGFIRDLPHKLVASFRSTLDEALDADHLLLVVDASDPEWRAQHEVTRETLASIGASVISQRLVLNKVDRLDAQTRLELSHEFPEALQMSALNADDISALRATLIATQDMSLCEETILVPFPQSQLLGEIHERAHVLEESHSGEGTILRLRARTAHLDRWRSKLPPTPSIETVDGALHLAARLGLELVTDEKRFDDSLDYRTVGCADVDETAWILRTPQSEEVFLSSRLEGRILRMLRARLPVELPEWRIHTPELIAHRVQSGIPASVLDPDELPAVFVDSVAEMLAALQAVPVLEAVTAQIPIQSLDEVRHEYRGVLQSASPPPGADVAQMWNRWLDAGSNWPRYSMIIHGNLRPEQMLVGDDGRLVGVLDWWDARVADPGHDFATWYRFYGISALEKLLQRFEVHGGRTWPGMIDHVLEVAAFHANFIELPGDLH